MHDYMYSRMHTHTQNFPLSPQYTVNIHTYKWDKSATISTKAYPTASGQIIASSKDAYPSYPLKISAPKRVADMRPLFKTFII